MVTKIRKTTDASIKFPLLGKNNKIEWDKTSTIEVFVEHEITNSDEIEKEIFKAEEIIKKNDALSSSIKKKKK